MNVAQAVLLSTVIFALTELVKTVVPGKLDPRLTQLVTVAVGIAAVFLVGQTVWAHTQILGGHTLDTLSAWDKVVAGILVSGGATGLDRVLKAVDGTQTAATPIPPAPAPAPTPAVGTVLPPTSSSPTAGPVLPPGVSFGQPGPAGGAPTNT